MKEQYLEHLCKKCGVEHPLTFNCKYNFFYQNWLLEELGRVNFAINTRL